ncbi:MAG: hypothetical protein ACLUKN_07975 [Bacilli bacterium]
MFEPLERNYRRWRNPFLRGENFRRTCRQVLGIGIGNYAASSGFHIPGWNSSEEGEPICLVARSTFSGRFFIS